MDLSKTRLIKLLIIDDDPSICSAISDCLEQVGLEILTAANASYGLQLFSTEAPEIVLLDVRLPDADGLQLVTKMVEENPAVNVVLMTGFYSNDAAIDAIKKGASDYLPKPINLDELRGRVSSLIGEARKRRRALELDTELVDTFQFEGIVGRSPLMLDVFAKIQRIAPHFRTVVVTGATGTGKEMVAKALHRLSPNAKGQFVPCNCSALVETLVESELFGHVRGAFTGATQDKAGVFEYANGGTVFLDEIGDMPLSAQAKLLRVLQDQAIQRVGSPATRQVQVRVIAATNRDLDALVKESKFREDLYYRLAMVEIRLPRLAERKEDLPLLQRHFVAKFAADYKKPLQGLTRRAQAALSSYHWPGNIRELENVIGNAAMMAEGDVIDVNQLPERILHPEPGGAEIMTLEELKRQHLLRVLDRVGGDKSEAAKVLGVSRATVYAMLAQMPDRPKGEESGADRAGRSEAE